MRAWFWLETRLGEYRRRAWRSWFFAFTLGMASGLPLLGEPSAFLAFAAATITAGVTLLAIGSTVSMFARDREWLCVPTSSSGEVLGRWAGASWPIARLWAASLGLLLIPALIQPELVVIAIAFWFLMGVWLAAATSFCVLGSSLAPAGGPGRTVAVLALIFVAGLPDLLNAFWIWGGCAVMSLLVAGSMRAPSRKWRLRGVRFACGLVGLVAADVSIVWALFQPAVLLVGLPIAWCVCVIEGLAAGVTTFSAERDEGTWWALMSSGMSARTLIAVKLRRFVRGIPFVLLAPWVVFLPGAMVALCGVSVGCLLLGFMIGLLLSSGSQNDGRDFAWSFICFIAVGALFAGFVLAALMRVDPTLDALNPLATIEFLRADASVWRGLFGLCVQSSLLTLLCVRLRALVDERVDILLRG